ncbi:SLBB domain-containing protein [Gloeobacter kilaueensis]|uniref:Polysaccharide export protein n=1 Tax=Gloeobacter kilaueensis (strain ATCC BAA-2537 / CCAP 1431/1 / ULC 316 / JS1) TaxID=1183438 RepID=U5QL99_GLOK1|nr:polysaccharide biosynthesis/export family protein [Gloeobacter kilaueensis]AGY59711.1 polysaccharide export protein [Gloeobacter kilaueensis JS1]
MVQILHFPHPVSRSLPAILLLSGFLFGSSRALAQSVPVAAQPPVQQFDLQAATSAYRIGPGDTIEVNVFGVPELTTSRVILADGTTSLPIIGAVRFAGMSQEEAAAELTELYRPYLENTQITVAITSPRPLTIAVLGEVNRPGPYTLTQGAGNTQVKVGSGEGTTGGVGGGRLTVSQALNLAGGVTDSADVEQITLRRKLPGSSRDSVQKINLWALLQTGDTSQDVPLLDGDSLTVPKTSADKPNYNIEQVLASTIAPNTIEVRVLGEVRQPGRVNVSPNAILTDALVAAGGLTDGADWKSVQLLRLNPDGTVTRKQLAAYLEEGRDPQKNPPLKKGDIISVPRSFGGSLVNTLQYLSPVFYLNSLVNLFRY